MNRVFRFTTGPYLLFAYALTSSAGLLLIKSGFVRTGTTPSLATILQAFASPVFVIGFALYVFSFAVWIGVLASMPLSTAYPLAIGLTMSCSTFGAAAMLGERLDLAKLVGIALVFAAVLLFTIGTRR
jgi:multidrug transporter EmrE-like cation transporter